MKAIVDPVTILLVCPYLEARQSQMWPKKHTLLRNRSHGVRVSLYSALDIMPFSGLEARFGILGPSSELGSGAARPVAVRTSTERPEDVHRDTGSRDEKSDPTSLFIGHPWTFLSLHLHPRLSAIAPSTPTCNKLHSLIHCCLIISIP